MIKSLLDASNAMSHKSYAKGDRRRIKCLRCQTVTNHQLKYTHAPVHFADSNYDPDAEEAYPDYAYEEIYHLWICLGCNSHRFEVISREVIPDEEEPVSFLYPQTTQSKKIPKSFSNLDSKLSELYTEAVKSYNDGVRIGCAALLRALLEAIIVDLKIKEGKLYQKITALGDSGKIPKETALLLHSFRFMGNTALHELKAPYEIELQIAIEAMEQLIYYIYDAQHDLHEKMISVASFRRSEIKKLYAADPDPFDK